MEPWERGVVQSDFLIHWTGSDIDVEVQPDWYKDHRLTISEEASEHYLKRLGDILEFGLWMTFDDNAEQFSVRQNRIVAPVTPRCCFTELRLSESTNHARKFGRLGIGVKRPFLFDRSGRPVVYLGFTGTRHQDRFFEACASQLEDKSLLNFFKPMNRKIDELTHEQYAESEWRLLFFDYLVEKGLLVDPRNPANDKEHRYFQSLTLKQQEKLRYLVPLDGWFAMIVYPALKTKNVAQWDRDGRIFQQIMRIKTVDEHSNHVEGLKNPIRGNWPIELNLSAAGHF
jgi:hypothetical protein